MSQSQQPATVRQREIEREVRESWEAITPEEIHAKLFALEGHPFRDALGHLLAVCIHKHAPQHTGLLPPAWVAHATEDTR